MVRGKRRTHTRLQVVLSGVEMVLLPRDKQFTNLHILPFPRMHFPYCLLIRVDYSTTELNYPRLKVTDVPISQPNNHVSVK